MIRAKYILTLVVVVALLWRSPSAAQNSDPFETALRWISGSLRDSVQYNYVMTARVRLLLFWVGADDVGGGYIRRSTSTDPGIRLIQVLFGSDPAKAPRKINHWGAATEAFGNQSSAFFGFMKSTKTESAAEAEAEMRQQKEQGRHAFQANLTFTRNRTAVSRVSHLTSEVDFNLNQLDRLQSLALQSLKENTRVRELTSSEVRCESSRGFLQAIDELAAHALNNGAAPVSLCYVYNSRNYTLTLIEKSRVRSKSIRVQKKNGQKLERIHRDLLETKFTVVNYKGERSTFDLLFGTAAGLRGVPVQITHQPNWWFQIVLNLENP
jgi:hypothetical protein